MLECWSVGVLECWCSWSAGVDVVVLEIGYLFIELPYFNLFKKINIKYDSTYLRNFPQHL